MPENELHYRPNPSGLDTHQFKTDFNANYTDDPVNAMGIDDLAVLAASPNWEDRVRAQVLHNRVKITLPDQFPCIYETPDSPSGMRFGRNYRLHAWVISPDIDMLHTLLPDYQEVWDAYHSQWGPSSRRLMAVGRADGLAPHSVYRPGTTPDQVISNTLLTHDGMYHLMPDRFKKLHPRHELWSRQMRNTLS